LHQKVKAPDHPRKVWFVDQFHVVRLLVQRSKQDHESLTVLDKADAIAQVLPVFPVQMRASIR
jgi:hypothetical protein